LTRLLAWIDTLERWAIAMLAAVALGLACVAMTARYLLPGVTLDWTFELTIFATIWATFLAAARTAAQGGHVRVDTLLSALPASARLALIALAGLAGVALALFLLVSGWIVVEEAARWDERTTSTLQLPLWIYYLSLPVGAGLLAFHIAVHTWRVLHGVEVDSLSRPEE
jgi:C4-dicarboxylate transporter DctQ subunit